ncbi:MAG: peptidoglycan-binding protein [Clostridia bacterium]|nr:peptidoglycan-binding protein [Clostridia bacterium]
MIAALLCAALLVLTLGTMHLVRHVRIKRALVFNDEGQVVGIRQLEDAPCTVYGFADSGDAVSDLQNRLQHYGYYEGTPTGFYGTDTVEAMQAFQRANALPVSGTADERTQTLLLGEDAISSSAYEIICSNAHLSLDDGTLFTTALSSSPMVVSAQVEVWDETSGEFVELAEGQDYQQDTEITQESSVVDVNNLKLGDESARVAQIQTRLQTLGYYRGASVTNYYGTLMQQAVYNFQKAHGMTMDGVCGEATQEAIFSEDAISFDAYIASGGVEYSARDELIAQLLQYAKRYIGCPYVWAGAGPSVFDCSGYTMYVYKHFGYNFGHGCVVQSNALGAQLSISQLLPGDMVFFDTNGGHNSLEHVGIYLGNGDFVHASSGQGRVMISNLYSGYYNTNFMWGKRVIPL